MVNPDTTRRLWSLGLFALPLVAAKLAALMLGGGSQYAGAAPQAAASENLTPAPNAAAGVGKVVWTNAQHAAAEYVSVLSTQAFGPSPMLHVPAPKAVEPEIVEREPPPVVVQAQPEPEPRPVFILQVLMTAPSGDKAVINGRAYIQGERIDDSAWIVREINVSSRTATLENDQTFERLVVFVQSPR